MASKSSNASSGIGLGGALGLLFIGLKLGKVIDWSWMWVLTPFWIPIIVFVGVVVCVLLVVGATAVFKVLTKGAIK